MSDANIAKQDTHGVQHPTEPVDEESGLLKVADEAELIKPEDEAELTRSEDKVGLMEAEDEAEPQTIHNAEDRTQAESTGNAKTEEATTDNAKSAHTLNANAENSMDAKTESTRDAESELKDESERKSQDELKYTSKSQAEIEPSVEIESSDQANANEQTDTPDQAEAAEEEPLLGPKAPKLPPRTRTQTPAPDRALDTRTHYRLKDMQWRDPSTGRTREVKIVTQNANGPCPLIALTNALQLTGAIQIVGSRRTISGDELTGMLADRLFQNDGGTVSETDVTQTLALLPTLARGLDVDLRFAHVYDFADSGPIQLFRAFGVDLVHGWVVDAELEQRVAGVLVGECSNSYEGAVEFILAADEVSHGQVVAHNVDDADVRGADAELTEKQLATVRSAIELNAWLEQTATQLTSCGLRMLGTMLPNAHLCVLFRNNHFSTLYKRAPGELFLLCTDDAVAGDSRIVWESLRDVHQTTSQFFDSQFRLLNVGGDYVQQVDGRGGSADAQEAAQIDEDYALALKLHEQEQQARQGRQGHAGQQGSEQLQVRQQDRMPPGMHVREHGHLYGVPEVSREGEAQLARAMYRSASDENFERRMENTFMPNKAATNSALRQQQKKHDDDKCIVC
ncbi:hypothetical protein IW148_001751 [Coemansia sp. RSA 1199]|nr:hypothetical protein IW148_001751 [Coemansia sp. RSA 1199]